MKMQSNAGSQRLYLKSHCTSFYAGCKENYFYSLPFGQAEASIYQPSRHFNQPQKLFVLLLFKFLIKHHLPVGQVRNRIHQPDSKILQPWAIGQYFLCTLYGKFIFQNHSRGYFYFYTISTIKNTNTIELDLFNMF